MAKGETKSQKMTRLAAQDRAGAAQLMARGGDYLPHAESLEKRAAQREKSAEQAARKAA